MLLTSCCCDPLPPFSPQEKSDEDKAKELEIEKDKEVHCVCVLCYVSLFSAISLHSAQHNTIGPYCVC